MTKLRAGFIMLCTIGLLILSGAATTQPIAPIDFTERTLDNGLHVIYAPLHQAPVVHVRVLYHVGSRDERPDRQGFAHMFEHMMFRGSAHVAPEEHMKRIGTVGGYSNAFTSFDETVYVDTLPSQYLEMALWLEADRMASFKVSESIYKTERKVVAEEWRMKNNKPYGTLFEDFLKTAFVKHSYRWTPIGNMEHLKAAPVSELQAFFNTYYVPNNATLVVAGDFDLDAAKAIVQKYFAWIPSASTIHRNVPAEPEQREAREITVNQPVPLPAIVVGYKVPAYTSDDHYALSLLSNIIGQGDSSRLRKLLVTGDSPAAVEAYALHMQLEDAGIFGVGAVVMQGKDPAKVQAAMTDTIAAVLKDGVTAEELAKAKTQARIELIHNRETAEDFAAQLGEESVFGRDAARANAALAKIDAVSVETMHDVAKKYLQPRSATVLRIKPSLLAAANVAAANKQAEAVKDAPVAPATQAIAPRKVEFPRNYPTTAPTAMARANPEFQQGTESDIDGVKVIVMTDTRLPLVNFSLTMRRGSQSDPATKEGTAWLTAEMIRRGVLGLSFQQLTRDLDSRGISITAGDGGDYTRLSGSCTTEQLDHAIERAIQILHSPTFPADELEKLKEQSANSLRLDQEKPGTVAANDLTRAVYGESVLGRYSTPKSVQAITLDDVLQFYRQIYQPAGAILVISGDVTVERGRQLAKTLLAGWSAGAGAGELAGVDYNLPEPSAARRIILVDRPEGKQATVRMAVRAYDIHSEDKFAGSVASHILSAGVEGRLMKYVRAEKGLCYDVRGSFSPNRQAGTFSGAVDTALESTGDAVAAMFKVLSDMRGKEVTAKELDDAKQRVAGGMVMGMQTIGQQAQYRTEGLLNGYPINYYDRYPERIAEVTAGQVRAVMNQYVDDARMTIVVVAPAAAVKEQLERLGPLEVVPMPAKRDRSATQPATQPSQELLKKAS